MRASDDDDGGGTSRSGNTPSSIGVSVETAALSVGAMTPASAGAALSATSAVEQLRATTNFFENILIAPSSQYATARFRHRCPLHPHFTYFTFGEGQAGQSLFFAWKAAPEQ